LVKYEDIVLNPETTIKRVFDYHELSFNPAILDEYSRIKLHGRGGISNYNKIGYKKINREHLNKWKNVLSNPLRKMYCRSYLRWIGKERLAFMGYDFSNLINELNSIPNNFQFFYQDLYLIP